MNNIWQVIYSSNEYNNEKAAESLTLPKEAAPHPLSFNRSIRPISTHRLTYAMCWRYMWAKSRSPGSSPPILHSYSSLGDESVFTLNNKNISTVSMPALNQTIEILNEFTPKLSIEAVCNISVELKTALKPLLSMALVWVMIRTCPRSFLPKSPLKNRSINPKR